MICTRCLDTYWVCEAHDDRLMLTTEPFREFGARRGLNAPDAASPWSRRFVASARSLCYLSFH
jgi:hypothetical protein